MALKINGSSHSGESDTDDHFISSDGNSDIELAVKSEAESDASEKDSTDSILKESNASEELVNGNGMGDVMSRILCQPLPSSSTPVLAKRKTKVMKAMEAHSKEQSEVVMKRAEKRAKVTQQLSVPDSSTFDREKQLKKIATRGVVALFNAIAQQQAHVKQQTPNESFNKLKTSKRQRNQDTYAARNLVKTNHAKLVKDEIDNTRSNKAQLGPNEEKNSWSVLQDDYMMKTRSLKNWDQESDSDGAEDTPKVNSQRNVRDRS